jgi:[ribosomal protein S5]-alanine N-acetyltransferase
MSDIPAIETGRLRLVSMTVECLRLMLDGEPEKAGASGGFGVPPDCALLGSPRIQRRLDMMEKDPEQHPWMYRAIVLKRNNAMVGYISFHHKGPDPDLLGYSSRAAELGYAIDAAHRRQGYARESALAMMEWAGGQGIGTFCLSISPRNLPALRLAESMGFRKVSERMDETDGLELVYLADIAEIRRRS